MRVSDLCAMLASPEILDVSRELGCRSLRAASVWKLVCRECSAHFLLPDIIGLCTCLAFLLRKDCIETPS